MDVITVATLANAARGDKPRSLILLTDSVRLADPVPAVLALPRGATVILRHYDAPDRASMAHALAALCRRRRIRFLVAGDARLARAVRADGIHLPENQLRRGFRRWQLWRLPGWWVSAAAHGRTAVHRAEAAGVDMVLLSPVFPTRSHPGARTLGAVRFAGLRRIAGIPVFALGGIGPETVRRAVCDGVAGIGGILALACTGR